jgi:hypothetical protein
MTPHDSCEKNTPKWVEHITFSTGKTADYSGSSAFSDESPDLSNFRMFLSKNVRIQILTRTKQPVAGKK